MNKKEALQSTQDTIKLIRDSVAFKPTERVANVSMFQVWQILDAGYKLSDAMSNYDIMEKVTRHHIEKYNFDVLVNTGTRNPYSLYRALESESYDINDEQGSINHKDRFYCHPNELKEMSDNYYKFIWEKGMERKYPIWNTRTNLDTIQKVFDEEAKSIEYSKKMKDILIKEYGMPEFCRLYPIPTPAIEQIFTSVRGISGFAIDLRRDPIHFKELNDTINEMFFKPQLEDLRNFDFSDIENFCFDVGNTYLCQNFLGRKQWDEFYWPYAKQVLDTIIEKDINYCVFIEGIILRFADYFKDFKKGNLAFILEKDNVFDFRKTLPNIAIIGGMDSMLLGTGTKRQCLDLAKRLIDELSEDSGYIMSQTKLGTFPIDGKSENIMAVNEFVSAYKPY